MRIIWGSSSFGLGGDVVGRALLRAGFRNELVELINVSEHLFEMFCRSVKRRDMGLPVEDLHRIFNGVCLLKQVKDGLPQLVSFGPARRHALGCGNKDFKVMTSHVQ